jgi:hypothetical protein
MAISWSAAVADADNPDDLQRYQRAVSQVCDLEPLVLSFADAVRKAGKWPQRNVSEYSVRMEYQQLRTLDERHIWIYPEGLWGITLGYDSSKGLTGILFKKKPGEEPTFWHDGGRTVTIAAEDFGARMDAMEETKDWVPRALVGYLRSENIPIPA